FTTPPHTYIYTLSLPDALPIYREHRRVVDASAEQPPDDQPDQQPARAAGRRLPHRDAAVGQRQPVGSPAQLASPRQCAREHVAEDRKSTRLNSSHVKISYAVFC